MKSSKVQKRNLRNLIQHLRDCSPIEKEKKVEPTLLYIQAFLFLFPADLYFVSLSRARLFIFSLSLSLILFLTGYLRQIHSTARNGVVSKYKYRCPFLRLSYSLSISVRWLVLDIAQREWNRLKGSNPIRVTDSRLTNAPLTALSATGNTEQSVVLCIRVIHAPRIAREDRENEDWGESLNSDRFLVDYFSFFSRKLQQSSGKENWTEFVDSREYIIEKKRLLLLKYILYYPHRWISKEWNR